MINHQGFTVINATSEFEGSSETVGSKPTQSVLEEFSRRAHESDAPIWEQTKTSDGTPVLMMSMPAVSGLRWGTLVASFDLSIYDSRVRDLYLFSLYTNVGFVLLLILALYAGISTVVLRPIQTLTSSMQELHRKFRHSDSTIMSGEMGELVGL